MNNNFLKVAKQAALEAGKIISFYTRKLPVQKDLGGSDITTKADFEAEAKIIEIISTSFPDHNIISEEKGNEGKTSEYIWIIDPLDGTISFISGVPFYAVSVGLLKGNQPIVGVVNRIAVNELYWAELGNGAFLNGNKISVSNRDQLKGTFLGLDFGYRNREEDVNRQFIPLIDKIRYPYVLGGVAATIALVAKGTLDGYVHRLKIWDVAAGVVLVTEAGGKFSDSKGQSINWLIGDGIEVVASNGLIHDQLIKALRR